MSGAGVEADFDRIARLPESGYDHYHDFLLKAAGMRPGEALDIGCGTGRFSRLLAARAEQVLGIDFSANMIDAARRQSSGIANLSFERADVLTWDWPVGHFDCIASIATLHHLPMAEVLTRMKAALRPAGALIVLDLYSAPRILDVIAVPWSLLLRLFYTGRLRQDPEARRLWAEHGKTDRYLSIAEVRAICTRILPGARIRRHLLWRYSIVWRNC